MEPDESPTEGRVDCCNSGAAEFGLNQNDLNALRGLAKDAENTFGLHEVYLDAFAEGALVARNADGAPIAQVKWVDGELHVVEVLT